MNALYEAQNMQLTDYLKELVDRDGSDLYLTTGAPVSAKFSGKLVPLNQTALVNGETKEVAYSIMNTEQIAQFEKKPEMNLAISEPGIGRFRVNIFMQRNQVA